MLNKRIKITGMNMTPAIQDYVHKKVDIISKFIDPEKETLAEINIGRTTKHHNKGDVYKSEINLTLDNHMFRASAVESDLYVAIDKMENNLVQEVTNAKKKKLVLFRKGTQKIKDDLKQVLN